VAKNDSLNTTLTYSKTDIYTSFSGLLRELQKIRKREASENINTFSISHYLVVWSLYTAHVKVINSIIVPKHLLHFVADHIKHKEFRSAHWSHLMLT